MTAHSASASSFVQSLPPRIEPQYVRIVGDSVGVVNLTPAALQCLADKLTQVLSRCSILAHKITLHGRRRTMKVEDVQHALRELSIPMPIGALTRSQPSMRQLRMPGGEQLYVREDVDVDVQSISQHSQAKVPVKRHIRVHWIRVDSEEEPPQEKKAKKASQASVWRFQRVFLQEQQIYLKEIVEACVGQDDRRRQQALQSLERDTGIQELLPRLSRLIHTSVRCNIVHRCLSMLIYVVRMMRSIAVNKSVKLDGVLHEFLPSLMSCMLGRVLCTRPDSDNHWALRDFAGKTLITIIKDHGTKETRRRSFRAVKRIFDEPSSSYSMIYGTITTLLEFASPVELIRLHPRFMVLLERTRTAAATSADQQERIEAHKLHAALTKHEPALRRLIKQAALASKKDHSKAYV
ncbi:unnamed protein product [Haemonchus placei]|uniref:Transcription initiation factor TFIID subunit 6 n=1 Tax=Haemonchus placei TaxID=6290 RepID=A0A0N4X0J8_HAEPC|nr:unnamed protein product [Haemonchus placei]